MIFTFDVWELLHCRISLESFFLESYKLKKFGDFQSDNIALRTRSKLPLNDTPLTEIEANFVAPDITPDLYDTDCQEDDWTQFLVGLMLDGLYLETYFSTFTLVLLFSVFVLWNENTVFDCVV